MGRTNLVLTLMVLPAVILLAVFHYLPLPGVVIAFAECNIGGFKKWVGFENFEYLLPHKPAPGGAGFRIAPFVEKALFAADGVRKNFCQYVDNVSEVCYSVDIDTLSEHR